MARRLALVAIVYGFLVLILFRPTAHELSQAIPSIGGNPSDAILYVWALSHVSRTLLSDPLNLFDGGIFHPAPYTLAYSDHMIGQALVGLPVWLASGNPVLELNLLALGSYVLCATALFAYARVHLQSSVAAFVAGLAFAFTPFRFDAAMWPQILFAPLMPLTLLFWDRFSRSQSWRDWALWVGCWSAHCLMGMYLALLFSLTMGMLILYGLLAAPARHRALFRIGSLLAPIAVLAVIAPTLWPYVYLRLNVAAVRPAVGWPVLSLLLPGVGTLSGKLLGFTASHLRGPGAVVGVLTVLGIALGWRRTRTLEGAERFRMGAHLVGLGFSLSLCAVPPHWLQSLPGLDALRTNSRAFPIALLFIALFAGETLSWILARVRRPRLARTWLGLLLLLVILDLGRPLHQSYALPPPSELPAPYTWLRDQPGGGAVFEHHAPRSPFAQAMSMYYSVFHRKPILGGYSGFVSPAWTYMAHRLRDFPSPATIALLREMEVRWVLWHFPRSAGVDPFLSRLSQRVGGSARLAARFERSVILELGPAPFDPHTPGAAAPLPPEPYRLTASGGAEQLVALLDGDRDTSWGIPGSAAGERWLQVDLGRPHVIAGIRCVPPGSDASGIFRSQVAVSSDGRTWEPVPARFEPASLRDLIERPARLEHFEARFAARRARYVRMWNLPSPAVRRFSGAPRFEMAEIRILSDCEAEPAPTCPETPASQDDDTSTPRAAD